MRPRSLEGGCFYADGITVWMFASRNPERDVKWSAGAPAIDFLTGYAETRFNYLPLERLAMKLAVTHSSREGSFAWCSDSALSEC